ncbi:GDSL-type esterase/lipase family protein [Rufibacter glacialis]|uniref:GDSL-type esterase/lipase family protein n=1 Tax=Rufibacter glacialis TaxID=1259555 RepID=A0A5M8QKQ5_9BACT|nr:GDSL-type esterase/lipase family protein [Rufibacter glacialis]KAA6435346.1 sialate O-acetylesterase [Rufibacter glacialis]GGK62567.1 sialate O-acetylesterase [Rufibacter glacialis]
MKLVRGALVAATFAFFSQAQAQAPAQPAKWDSTYRPGSFDLKVQQFQSYPNSSKDIIFLGNSLTANTDWAELLGMPQAKNRGISGDITFGVLERLHEVIEGKPAKVFILIGINDISRNVPDQVILANYQKMISRIKAGSPKTKIYFQTLLPTNESFGKFKNHYHKEEHILWVNNALKDLAKKEKIEVVDLYPHFLDQNKKLVSEYTHDGLHLTVAGYQKWVEVLKKGNYLK